MALACRWRSRPQHQKQTRALQQGFYIRYLSSIIAATNDKSRTCTLPSNAPLVAPGQHMKLWQHSCGKPKVRSHFADKPSKPGQQIVDLGLIRTRLPGEPQPGHHLDLR